MQSMTRTEIEELQDKTFQIDGCLPMDEDMRSDYIMVLEWTRYYGMAAGSYESPTRLLRSILGNPAINIIDGMKHATWGFKASVAGSPDIPFIFTVSTRGSHVETIHEATVMHLKSFLKEFIKKVMPDEAKRREVA